MEYLWTCISYDMCSSSSNIDYVINNIYIGPHILRFSNPVEKKYINKINLKYVDIYDVYRRTYLPSLSWMPILEYLSKIGRSSLQKIYLIIYMSDALLRTHRSVDQIRCKIHLFSPRQRVAFFPLGWNMRTTTSTSHTWERSLTFFAIPFIRFPYVIRLFKALSNLAILTFCLPITKISVAIVKFKDAG